MKPSEIENQKWHVFDAVGECVAYGKSNRTYTLAVGTKGYLKRNAHDPRYFQVVGRTVDGALAGWYVKDELADRICAVTVPAPKFANPDKHWSAHWAARFA